MSSSITRKRIDNSNADDMKEENTDTHQRSTTQRKSLRDNFQTLGLLALIICIIFIGFQMTSNDAYNHINKNVISVHIEPTTPSPTHSGIEVVVHEDDGDVEIDVPQQIPPDLLQQNKKSSKLHPLNPFHPKGRRQGMNNHTKKVNITHIHNRNKRIRMINPRNRKNQTISDKHKTSINRYRPMINIRDPGTNKMKHPINLPTMEQMIQNTSRYYYSPINVSAKMYGFHQQCTDNAACTAKKHRFALVAGLYNTGTNIAYKLIHDNCMTQMKYQPAWGKHEMITQEKIEYWNEQDLPPYNPLGLYHEAILVVVIKDPLTWLKSMCKANYDFKYYNRSWFFESCPGQIKHSRFNWLPMNRGKKINRERISNGIYDSPIHLWNDWYSTLIDTVNATQHPFLVVRFEDLLFRVKSVVKQFCGCFGYCRYKKGTDDDNIQISAESAKPHGNPRNRTMSFWAYSNPGYRYDGYSKMDLQFMLDNINHTLLEIFGYQFDVEKTMRMRL